MATTFCWNLDSLFFFGGFGGWSFISSMRRGPLFMSPTFLHLFFSVRFTNSSIGYDFRFRDSFAITFFSRFISSYLIASRFSPSSLQNSCALSFLISLGFLFATLTYFSPSSFTLCCSSFSSLFRCLSRIFLEVSSSLLMFAILSSSKVCSSSSVPNFS